MPVNVFIERVDQFENAVKEASSEAVGRQVPEETLHPAIEKDLGGTLLVVAYQRIDVDDVATGV